MNEQWKELKETIIELRDGDGTGTQQEVCKFLVNYMGILEKQMQEPCEDEYVKVPKKALKYRTAGMVVYNAEWLKNNFDIERAVICGAQEPCEDAISREDALMCLTGEIKETDTIETIIARFVRRIRKLPPVKQAKTGHWIEHEIKDTCRWLTCSACGYEWVHKKENFCPNCGFRMIEPQESEG